MERIMIIGAPGAGKTWLAGQISAKLGLPVISVDQFVHDRGGKLRPADTIDQDVRAAAELPRWIIEGGNTRTYGDRVARADCVIRLKLPRLLRLWRVWRREGVNPGLWRGAWRYERVLGDRDEAVLSAAGGTPVYDLRSAAAVRAFLRILPCPLGMGASPMGKG